MVIEYLAGWGFTQAGNTMNGTLPVVEKYENRKGLVRSWGMETGSLARPSVVYPFLVLDGDTSTVDIDYFEAEQWIVNLVTWNIVRLTVPANKAQRFHPNDNFVNALLGKNHISKADRLEMYKKSDKGRKN